MASLSQTLPHKCTRAHRSMLEAAITFDSSWISLDLVVSLPCHLSSMTSLMRRKKALYVMPSFHPLHPHASRLRRTHLSLPGAKVDISPDVYQPLNPLSQNVHITPSDTKKRKGPPNNDGELDEGLHAGLIARWIRIAASGGSANMSSRAA